MVCFGRRNRHLNLNYFINLFGGSFKKDRSHDLGNYSIGVILDHSLFLVLVLVLFVFYHLLFQFCLFENQWGCGLWLLVFKTISWWLGGLSLLLYYCDLISFLLNTKWVKWMENRCCIAIFLEFVLPRDDDHALSTTLIIRLFGLLSCSFLLLYSNSRSYIRLRGFLLGLLIGIYFIIFHDNFDRLCFYTLAIAQLLVFYERDEFH